MTSITVHSDPGCHELPNEDHYVISPSTAFVIDGIVGRSHPNCVHDVRWFVARLGESVQRWCATGYLGEGIARSITETADLHGSICDVSNPVGPAAGIGVVRLSGDRLEWLVLGQVTLALFDDRDVEVVTTGQQHVASKHHDDADRYLIGDPRKNTALDQVREAELAARSTVGGFWVAADAPEAAQHALTGQRRLGNVTKAILATDGAARLVDVFRQETWSGVGDLIEVHGPQEVVRRVRECEAADPLGSRWPRATTSDDATVVVIRPYSWTSSTPCRGGASCSCAFRHKYMFPQS